MYPTYSRSPRSPYRPADDLFPGIPEEPENDTTMGFGTLPTPRASAEAQAAMMRDSQNWGQDDPPAFSAPKRLLNQIISPLRKRIDPNYISGTPPMEGPVVVDWDAMKYKDNAQFERRLNSGAPSPVFLDMQMSKNNAGGESQVGMAFNRTANGGLAPTNRTNVVASGGGYGVDPQAESQRVWDLYNQKVAGNNPNDPLDPNNYVNIDDFKSPDRGMSVMGSQGPQPVTPVAAPGADQFENIRNSYLQLPEDYRMQVPFIEHLRQQTGGQPQDFQQMPGYAPQQGAPMGATPGSISPQFGQPGAQPNMPGGMSSPYMQNKMAGMMDQMLNQQSANQNFNRFQTRRDGYDDTMDRLRADVLNPLMGGFIGGRGMANLQQDSNSRRSAIMDRRQLGRQASIDQWSQTKDLATMMAANDPEAIKNQNALAKLQIAAYNASINGQNANTNQFSAGNKANYQQGMLSVAQQNSQTAMKNMESMLQSRTHTTQQGYMRIAQTAATAQANLDQRAQELQFRMQQDQRMGNQFNIQQSLREQQELNDQQQHLDALKFKMESEAAELDSHGNAKHSEAYVNKYGIKEPAKAAAPAATNPVDLIQALSGFAKMFQPQAAAAATAPAPKGTTAARPATAPKPATSGGGKPLTADAVAMAKAKYPDRAQAMAYLKKLGYKL